jgi:perosamine synthetase
MDKLALYGGRPVREKMVPYGSQWISEEDKQAVLGVLDSDFLTQGPKIQEFEETVARQSGAKYAVAFSNGTAALHGACYAAGIKSGDEVITTPLTFAATSNCILYQGGTPVFADVDERTYLLDIDKCREKVNKKTKAIIPVDFSGQPVNMRAFRSFADEYGLVFIQDAAHSLGASYDGELVGSIADMTMFSFHPVKPVTTAEGGVIVTNSEEYYEKLLLFRSHGITRDSNLLVNEKEGPWYYEMLDLGYNYRLTDIQAALGLSQLKRLQQFLDQRAQIAKKYTSAFSQLQLSGILEVPFQDEYSNSGWHLYILRLNLSRLQVDRSIVFDALRAENIGVNVHYIPVYFHPYYQRLGYSLGTSPITEHLYRSFITLPLFPKMSVQDVDDVIFAVNKVLNHFKI